MAKVLVTGATGFIGSALTRKLLDRGDEVHILARQKNPPYTNLEDLPVRVHHGDIQNAVSLRGAMKGLDYVYHAAAVYQFYPWWKRKNLAIHKINIQGTRNVVEAARWENIRKIVYTSSIITIGRKTDGSFSNENTSYDPAQSNSNYARSKLEAERFVLEETKRGLPAVVVNPGITLGERDHKPTPSGEIIIKFLNRVYPCTFETTWCVAGADDVADGHIAAMEKGKIGERYILCNREHYSMAQIFRMLEKITGVRAPRFSLPLPLIRAFAYADEGSARWIKHQPLLSTEGLRFCSSRLKCNNAKAVRELGYANSPIETALEKAVQWYRDHGYVEK